MKKRLTFWVLLLLMIFAFFLPYGRAAGPYLICDPYPASSTQPTSFNVYMDGGQPISSPAFKNADGSVQLHYDLSTLSVGSHTVQSTAVINDVWGKSETPKSTAFPFVKRDSTVIPTVPVNQSISSQ